VFFTNGGAEANENAIRMARVHTGRHKVLTMYRSYHGSTAAAITATGDPRRWANEPTAVGLVHFWGPYPYRSPFIRATRHRSRSGRCSTCATRSSSRARRRSRPCSGDRGRDQRRARAATGIPGRRREICDEYGIVLIADEVMAGFGRCGEWFAVDRWRVTPDLITFAKGVNSGYLPLGGVIISDPIAETFRERVFPVGSRTPAIRSPVPRRSRPSRSSRRRDRRVRPALGEEVIGPALHDLAARHPSVGEVRGLGVFWALELVRDRDTREPLVPYNASGAAATPMAEVAAACKQRGLWPFTHFNRVHVVPPCTITSAEVRDGIAILDEALGVADGYYTGS
jgi:taurine--2-oxoglutarate transaminase